MRHVPPHDPDSPAARPTTFEVGEHLVVVTKVRDGVWTVAVDGRALPDTYATQAAAWEAGVREAFRADARAP